MITIENGHARSGVRRVFVVAVSEDGSVVHMEVEDWQLNFTFSRPLHGTRWWPEARNYRADRIELTGSVYEAKWQQGAPDYTVHLQIAEEPAKARDVTDEYRLEFK